MPKYSLSKKDKSYLTLEIEGKNYNIPLANTLKVKELRKLLKLQSKTQEDQLDFLIEFFGKYMGEDVIDDMTIPDLHELFEIWGKANEEAGGLPLGESSASHDS